jgi:hypothetical protein
MPPGGLSSTGDEDESVWVVESVSVNTLSTGSWRGGKKQRKSQQRQRGNKGSQLPPPVPGAEDRLPMRTGGFLPNGASRGGTFETFCENLVDEDVDVRKRAVAKRGVKARDTSVGNIRPTLFQRRKSRQNRRRRRRGLHTGWQTRERCFSSCDCWQRVGMLLIQ